MSKKLRPPSEGVSKRRRKHGGFPATNKKIKAELEEQVRRLAGELRIEGAGNDR